MSYPNNTRPSVLGTKGVELLATLTPCYIPALTYLDDLISSVASYLLLLLLSHLGSNMYYDGFVSYSLECFTRLWITLYQESDLYYANMRYSCMKS